jgi:uncharacterized protein (TIGR03546 family)
MILWIFKLISTARRAIAGRKYPHQLAWGVAFGLLLGVIPHGNLLAAAILLIVLSLKINHAMAGLTAVGTTFLATHLDPYSDQVGQYVLSDPKFHEIATAAWQLPMMPWTNLNNTVVMGSFLIGVASLLPVFAVTYPIFRLFAPRQSDGDPKPAAVTKAEAAKSSSKAHQVVLIDQRHGMVTPPPHRKETEEVKFEEIREASSTSDRRVTVETRIDVIRMKDHRGPSASTSQKPEEWIDPQPMDEALNYLLRQLRDSQKRKAA